MKARMCLCLAGLVSLLFASVNTRAAAGPAPEPEPSPQAEFNEFLEREWRDQFVLLVSEINALRTNPGKRAFYDQRVRPTVFHTASLIGDADRDPVDVVARRTRVLRADLRQLAPDLDLSAEAKELDALQAEVRVTDPVMETLRRPPPSSPAKVPSRPRKTSSTDRHIKSLENTLQTLMEEADPMNPEWDPERTPLRPSPKPKPAGTAAKKPPQPPRRARTLPAQAPIGTARYDLYVELCRLRRLIALRNPLFDFDTMLVCRRSRGESHIAGQLKGYMQRGSTAEGGIWTVSGMKSGDPVWRNILADRKVAGGRLAGHALTNGWFARPSLSYDARQVAFAWREPVAQLGGHESYEGYYFTGYSAYRTEWSFHVFAAPTEPDAPGELRMLTDGPHNDASPVFLPNGRIAFVSDRRGGVDRCGGPARAQVLHSMLPDGRDVVPLSVHETEEWSPCVGHDGRLYFSRWDYVDRGDCIAHHPWVCYPDGRDPRALHGNYSPLRRSREDAVSEYEHIPGSHRFVAVATGHHFPGHDGSLIVLDFSVADDGALSQVRRLTPEVLFPETEGHPGALFATPWPLAEKYHLAAWSYPAAGGDRPPQGVYLVDAFGNRVLLARPRSGTGCYSPTPLRSRARPPVIPHMAATGKPGGFRLGPSSPAPEQGRFLLMNVYDSLLPWPANTQIRSLRIMQIFPRANGIWMNYPDIGIATESLARGLIGTVPVEEDGSAHFTIPANIPVYFQAVDGQGRAVQTMRSATWVQPGVTVACQGCHETKGLAPTRPSAMPLALRREASVPVPGPDGSSPLHYPLLVQPVLDRHCVACHTREREKGTPKVADLRGQPVRVRAMSPGHGPATWWSKSYQSLTRFANCRTFGGKPVSGSPRTVPGTFGAIQSRLFPLLADGEHHDTVMPPEDLRRIAIWLDNNLNFSSAYLDTQKQAEGMCVMPMLTHADAPMVRTPTPSQILAQSAPAKQAAGKEPGAGPAPQPKPQPKLQFDVPKLEENVVDLLEQL